MEQPKHWLVGPHFDLFGPEKQALAAQGVRDGILPEADLQGLCTAVLDHGERHRRIMAERDL